MFVKTTSHSPSLVETNGELDLGVCTIFFLNLQLIT
jgi:hypothetical protein